MVVLPSEQDCAPRAFEAHLVVGIEPVDDQYVPVGVLLDRGLPPIPGGDGLGEGDRRQARSGVVGCQTQAVQHLAPFFPSPPEGREIDHHYFEVYQGEEPKHLRVLSRHFSNLVEIPPLFYIACIIAFVTDQRNGLVLGLAWAFVALRFLHTLIHLGNNVVALRFRVFVLSIAVFTAMWVVLFIGTL